MSSYQSPNIMAVPKRSHLSESQAQCRVAEWLDARGMLWCHVPNGQLRSKRVAAQLKREGVKAGVPDILIFDRPPSKPEFVGVALELKRTINGRTSEAQERWLKALDKRKWYACVAKGHLEAIDILIELGYGPDKI